MLALSRGMRRSRKLSLNVTGLFHKMWRGHNREYIFADNKEKVDYIEQLGRSRTEDTEAKVQWHSFSIMGNHTHETGALELDQEKMNYAASVRELGNWMRRAHSRFGAGYNKRHRRQGKVAYDRPKTCEIEDNCQLLKVMFYIDANPVRAGIVSHPSQYKYSSYDFYAYGKKTRLTKHLTPPRAYLALGKTPEARQKKYRQLCDQYLREAGLVDDDPSKEMEALFIGSETWQQARRSMINSARKARAAPS